MTSDFFITTINGPSIIEVKASDELSNLRVREKLEIERRYWNMQNIRWRVVTENQINKIKARNIEWLSQAKDLSQFGITDEEQKTYTAYFISSYTDDMEPLGGIICGIEQKYNLPQGMGLNIYKHLAYWKKIAFNACEKIDYTKFIEKSHHDGISSNKQRVCI
jgi:chorismate synthase